MDVGLRDGGLGDEKVLGRSIELDGVGRSLEVNEAGRAKSVSIIGDARVKGKRTGKNSPQP